MRNSTPLRWIAEAEARSVREIAFLQANEAQLLDNSTHDGAGSPGWIERLRKLFPSKVREPLN